jgi:acetate kinase
MSTPRLVLTINCGSSSVKFALHRTGAGEHAVLRGKLDRIGLADAHFTARAGEGGKLIDDVRPLPNHAAALRELFGWLAGRDEGRGLDAVGHRVVHGGPRHDRPRRVTPELMADLRGLVPLAPNHLPAEIDAIDATERALPGMPQVACFDTAFHRTLPPAARTYALPADVRSSGVERFGFHGLSCEYVMTRLRQDAGEPAGGRVVVAHLGNGASLAAVKGGTSIDTTMGFTPTGGLVMGTRTGDLDPGVLVYLMRERGLDAAALDELVTKRSGLAGLSGGRPDMHDLEEREASDPAAALAVEVFCHTARKHLAAMAASLGGLDLLAFTGGIGENSVAVRRRICEPLGFLGVALCPVRNAAGDGVVSADSSRVPVFVVRTDEELMIARHAAAVLDAV